ncbi:hypothetical protein SDJN02_11522, partial [Cucurbita argyrosperma subsp. argyrosperma]
MASSKYLIIAFMATLMFSAIQYWSSCSSSLANCSTERAKVALIASSPAVANDAKPDNRARNPFYPKPPTTNIANYSTIPP